MWTDCDYGVEKDAANRTNRSLTMSDTIVLGGMAVAIVAGIYGAKRGHNPFCRAGSAFSALAACVGLAYFGYRPFFGGTHHDIGTYFGCITLIVSVVAWLLFMAIDGALGKPTQAQGERQAHREP